MMDASDISFTRVYTRDGGWVMVEYDEADKLDALVSQFLDGGQTRDSLIYLACVDGSIYVTRASEVTSWTSSTPASRERTRDIEAALKSEAAPWDTES